MLFRTQKIAVRDDGAVMAADETTVELHRDDRRVRQPGRAAARRTSTPMRTVDLDVLDADNAATYWERDERHDLAVSLNRGRPALDALCRVLRALDRAFPGRRRRRSRPQREIDDERWVWHVGLDAEASALLNDLYNRVDVDDARMGRLLCLFELDVRRSRPTCGPRSPAGPSISRWRWTPSGGSSSSRRTSFSTCRSRGRSDRIDRPMIRLRIARCRRAARGCARDARRRPCAQPTAGADARPPATPRPPHAAAPTAAAADPLARFAWLDGCWRGNVNQREFREQWMPLRGAHR